MYVRDMLAIGVLFLNKIYSIVTIDFEDLSEHLSLIFFYIIHKHNILDF